MVKIQFFQVFLKKQWKFNFNNLKSRLYMATPSPKQNQTSCFDINFLTEIHAPLSLLLDNHWAKIIMGKFMFIKTSIKT
jgi:hypothetical protein